MFGCAKRNSKRSSKSDTDSPHSGIKQHTVVVSFNITYHAEFGQTVGIMGSNTKLGSWQASSAVSMKWAEGDLWKLDLELISDVQQYDVEYKFIVKDDSGNAIRTESGHNHVAKVIGQTLSTHDTWNES